MLHGQPGRSLLITDPLSNGQRIGGGGFQVPATALDRPILIVDDDSEMRLLIRGLLEGAGYQTREIDSGEQVLGAARRERPLLVILDVHLPGISGYEVCRQLRESFGEDPPIIFLSGDRMESYDRVAGLLIGADDYMVKPFATDELLARVRLLTRRVGVGRGLASKLSSREVEVLRLLAVGLGLKQIAARLVISTKTVSTHIEHIFLKLGVQTRAQAVAIAYTERLVTPADSADTPAAFGEETVTGQVPASSVDLAPLLKPIAPLDWLTAAKKGDRESA